MTVSEAMEKRGSENFPAALCGECILGINIDGSDSTDGYAVFSAGGTELDSGVVSEIEKRKFVRAGSVAARTFAVRKFTIVMDARADDPLCRYLTSSDTVFAREKEAVTDYVFINVCTGNSESGKAVIDVRSTAAGKADDFASVEAVIYGYPDRSDGGVL